MTTDNTTCTSSSSTANAASMVSVVRVAGTPTTGTELTTQLLQALQWYRDHNHEATTTNASSGNATTASDSFPWQWPISNRYFDAVVQLDTAMNNNNNNNNNINNTVEDGIILVFSNDAPADFDALHHIHEDIIKTHDSSELLRLCLGMGTTTTNEDEDEYARRILWCLDRGYEYIPGVDVNHVEIGHDQRDKDGFARFVEALQSTVWSTALPKKNNNHKTTTTSSIIAQQLLSEQDEQEAIHNKDDTNHDNAYEPPPTTLPLMMESSNAVDDEQEVQQREEAARKALLEGVTMDGEKNSDTLQNPTTTRDDDQDHTLQQLEHAIQEAARIRDLSKSGHFVSDEERRQRAGDAALRLMNLMGMEDDGDDEHGSSSDDEDDAVVAAIAAATVS